MATPQTSKLAMCLLQLKENVNSSSPEGLTMTTQDSMSPDNDKEACNCRKSKCLKLYCQCFAAKVSCSSSCRCLTCENTDDHVEQKLEAIRGIMERNPHAFDSKFKAADTIGMNTSGTSNVIAHKSGCRCRKSMCLKKYCECFQAGVSCSSTCTCLHCCNTTTKALSGSMGGVSSSMVLQSSSMISSSMITRTPINSINTDNSFTNQNRSGDDSIMKAVQNLGNLRERCNNDVNSSLPFHSLMSPTQGFTSPVATLTASTNGVSSCKTSTTSEASSTTSVSDGHSKFNFEGNKSVCMASMVGSFSGQPLGMGLGQGQDAENALLKHINKPPMMPLKRKSSDISTETQLGIAFDHGIRTNSSSDGTSNASTNREMHNGSGPEKRPAILANRAGANKHNQGGKKKQLMSKYLGEADGLLSMNSMNIQQIAALPLTAQSGLRVSKLTESSINCQNSAIRTPGSCGGVPLEMSNEYSPFGESKENTAPPLPSMTSFMSLTGNLTDKLNPVKNIPFKSPGTSSVMYKASPNSIDIASVLSRMSAGAASSI